MGVTAGASCIVKDLLTTFHGMRRYLSVAKTVSGFLSNRARKPAKVTHLCGMHKLRVWAGQCTQAKQALLRALLRAIPRNQLRLKWEEKGRHSSWTWEVLRTAGYNTHRKRVYLWQLSARILLYNIVTTGSR